MPHPGYYRTNRRDVWQYYQVDRFGSWRPVVVWGPYGAYYLYNGQPYPWATVNSREVLSVYQGTPYRAAVIPFAEALEALPKGVRHAPLKTTLWVAQTFLSVRNYIKEHRQECLCHRIISTEHA